MFLCHALRAGCYKQQTQGKHWGYASMPLPGAENTEQISRMATKLSVLGDLYGLKGHESIA